MQSIERVSFTQTLKNRAFELGFDLAGAVSASDPFLPQALSRYDQWLAAGYGASMDYLKKHAELKGRPERLLPGCRSVFCVGLLYGDEGLADNGDQSRVSLYARGRDYHAVMNEKLSCLADWLDERGVRSRAFVDAEPVLERFWAWRAGLGWLGKNTMLINRKHGSYIFLGGLLIAAELEIDAPQPDHCGRCRKCIDACPTMAITEARSVDSGKCIAYHTIENRGSVPRPIMEKTGRWVAGCDICQEVCPWNDPVAKGAGFEDSNPAYGASLMQLASWTSADFKSHVKNTAMSRVKYHGFLRNLSIAISNSGLEQNQKNDAFRVIRGHLEAQSDKARDGGQNGLAPGLEGVLAALEWAESRS